MNINFARALEELGPDAAFRIANESRMPGDYLFATLLPERRSNTYHVDSGSMSVRTTMAGIVGMDSPYTPGGVISVSKFLEESAKLALEVALPEKSLRELQSLITQRLIAGNPTTDLIQSEALNFFQKVILQGQWDRVEWMRGQALVNGAIDWTFNGINLLVDYGIPSAHVLTTRTTGGGDAYGANNSAFWTDVREAKRLLRNNLRAAIAHPDTIDEIVYNDANSLQVIDQTDMTFTLQRLRTIGGNTVESRDARDRIQLISYDREGEIIDPANPGSTTRIPFMPRGKIAFVANNRRTDYHVGEGSTNDPQNDQAIGYTHIAPTVESGGMPGRWGEVFTPKDRPWTIIARGVENSLPVIEVPEKIVVATTELA